MILKEGPAQTIKVIKEQILVPSKTIEFNLLTKTSKLKKAREKFQKVEKVINEFKKPKMVYNL